MFRSHSFVSFMLRSAALGGGAMLLAACPPTGSSSMCCCVTGANNIRNCSPVSNSQACQDGVVEPCTAIGLGGSGPGSRHVPPDGGAR